jgi:glutamate synthase domain-containing protein 3
MSGGVAYVLDRDGTFERRLNTGMVDLEPLDDDDWKTLREMITRHVQFTNSSYAKAILSTLAGRPFVKVMPRDYKRVMKAEARARAENREPEFAELVGSV